MCAHSHFLDRNCICYDLKTGDDTHFPDLYVHEFPRFVAVGKTTF
jgi:hypothetical protein